MPNNVRRAQLGQRQKAVGLGKAVWVWSALVVLGVGAACADVPKDLFGPFEPSIRSLAESDSSNSGAGQAPRRVAAAVDGGPSRSDVDSGSESEPKGYSTDAGQAVSNATPGSSLGGVVSRGRSDAGAADAPSVPTALDAGGANPSRPDAGSGPFELPVEERPLDDGSCPSSCSAAGGRCAGGACVFDCDSSDACAGEQTVCPQGTSCSVRCGDGSCQNNVVCRDGATCEIECSGEGSCADEIICEGDCRVTCSGEGSCAGGVGGSVQRLDLVCSGLGSCGQDIQCEGQQCLIDCSGDESCARVITYGQVNVVSCSGANACDSQLLCSGGSCQIACAQGACGSGILCAASNCSGVGTTTQPYGD